MNVIVKFNSQTDGRDKLAKLIQYASKIVWHQMELKNANKYTIDRLRNLEVTFNNFRKILRLGRSADLLFTAIDSLSIEDNWIRISVFLSKIATGLYFYADHLVWIAKAGFMGKLDANKWTQTANKFWLISTIMNILRDIYEIMLILDIKTNQLLKPSFLLESGLKGFSMTQLRHLWLVMNCHKSVFIDTLKNGCDLFIPLTALGITRFSTSTVGLLGVISSLAAIVMMVDPSSKLSPS